MFYSILHFQAEFFWGVWAKLQIVIFFILYCPFSPSYQYMRAINEHLSPFFLPDQTIRTMDLQFLECSPLTVCPMSGVRCQVSGVRCQLSCVTCLVYDTIPFNLCRKPFWWKKFRDTDFICGAWTILAYFSFR